MMSKYLPLLHEGYEVCRRHQATQHVLPAHIVAHHHGGRAEELGDLAMDGRVIQAPLSVFH
jgi:hypothetical protein